MKYLCKIQLLSYFFQLTHAPFLQNKKFGKKLSFLNFNYFNGTNRSYVRDQTLAFRLSTLLKRSDQTVPYHYKNAFRSIQTTNHQRTANRKRAMKI